MDNQPLSLDHPLAKAAKARFDKSNSQRKISFTFEELYSLFKEEKETFRELAEKAGVTRQAIHILYHRLYKELLKKTGHDRRRAISIKAARDTALKAEIDFLRSGPLAPIAQAAQRSGCTVKAILRHHVGHQLSAKMQWIEINGKLCSVHFLTAPWKLAQSRRYWTRASITYSVVEKADALIFRTEVEGYQTRNFIVSSEELKAAHFRRNPKQKTIYLPLEQLPTYHNRKTRIDWWQRENAWHVF